MTVVPMPEATVYEYNGMIFRQNNIGITGKVFSMNSETVTCGMHGFSNKKLRFRILTTNSAHIP